MPLKGDFSFYYPSPVYIPPPLSKMSLLTWFVQISVLQRELDSLFSEVDKMVILLLNCRWLGWSLSSLSSSVPRCIDFFPVFRARCQRHGRHAKVLFVFSKLVLLPSSSLFSLFPPIKYRTQIKKNCLSWVSSQTPHSPLARSADVSARLAVLLFCRILSSLTTFWTLLESTARCGVSYLSPPKILS